MSLRVAFTPKRESLSRSGLQTVLDTLRYRFVTRTDMIDKILKKLFYTLFICIAFFSCKKNSEQNTQISFYHWRSNFNLSSQEKDCLKNNACKTLYLKYFDVVKEEGKTKPVSIIHFSGKTDLKVIPVIFIKNNVFINTKKNEIDTLVVNITQLINQINSKNNITYQTIQFDCDWTDKTQQLYFYFLEQFGKNIQPKKISATIRLHQIKYKFKTGVPPVNIGTLMFYNMGKIAGDTLNSIYSKKISEKYISYLQNYPLTLNIALPVFGWGIQSRQGNVINLLNKMTYQDFISDTNFIQQTTAIFKAKNYCFKAGYYFIKNDVVKLESVSEEQLLEMAELINDNIKQTPAEIIFYDLDTINLNRYDKNIFKKTVAAFN